MMVFSGKTKLPPSSTVMDGTSVPVKICVGFLPVSGLISLMPSVNVIVYVALAAKAGMLRSKAITSARAAEANVFLFMLITVPSDKVKIW